MQIEHLRKLIRYDPETGMTFWRERGAWVVDEGLQTDLARRKFNAKYAGKPCMAAFDKDGYLRGWILGQMHRAHRVVYAMHHGVWPSDTVDHANRNRTDNRIENLVDATRAQQQVNRNVQKNNSSGAPGVHFDNKKNKWIARETVQGRRAYLGFYESKEEAIEAKRNYAHHRSNPFCTNGLTGSTNKSGCLVASSTRLQAISK